MWAPSAQASASMKEGRFRPSLQRVQRVLPVEIAASMKEGRFRPSLASISEGFRGFDGGLNEGGSVPTLVGPIKWIAAGIRGAPQ